MLLFWVLLVLLGISTWRLAARPTRGFLPDFATLLARPEIGLRNFRNELLSTGASLNGEFHGRKVVVLLQYYTGRYQNTVIVSMETHSAKVMKNYDFEDYKPDRASELARVALQEHHKFRLTHCEGCLEAQRQWHLFANFPPPFEAETWKSILEAMHTLAGSLEPREASFTRVQ